MQSSGLILLAVAVLISIGLGQDVAVSGKVVDIDGRPMEGVRVNAYHEYPAGGTTKIEVTTDKSGSFAVDHVGRALSFYKDGFQPAAVLVKPGAVATVTLNPGAPTDWRLSECGPKPAGRRYGDPASFSIPSHARLHPHSGEDTADVVVDFPGNKREKMLIWYGPSMFAFGVWKDFIVNASPLSMREVGIRGVIRGTDARGTDKNQKQWRSVEIGELVEYRGVSNDAAHFFDEIIDSACVPQTGEPGKRE